MIDAAGAGLDIGPSKLLLAEVLAQPLYDGRPRNEHRGSLCHHRIVAASRAAPNPATEPSPKPTTGTRAMFAVVYAYHRVPPMPPGRLAAPLVSMVFTEPPPPEPSINRMMGRRKSCAISSAISGFAEIEASAEPPRTVKSSPTTTTVRPSILPRPNTQLAGVRLVSSPLASYSATPEIAPISWKVF